MSQEISDNILNRIKIKFPCDGHFYVLTELCYSLCYLIKQESRCCWEVDKTKVNSHFTLTRQDP